MRFRLVLALLPLVALIACGGDDDPTTAVDPTSTSTTTTTSTAAPVDVAVHIEHDGIAVNGNALRFGATRDDVTLALGPPTEEGEEEECPGSASSFLRYDDDRRGLVLLLQDGELVGWSLDPDSTLTTSAGIGIGSTKAELEAAHGPVEMFRDSTLGIEFFYDGGMTGLLEVDAPEGAITAIWSGVACVFR